MFGTVSVEATFCSSHDTFVYLTACERSESKHECFPQVPFASRCLGWVCTSVRIRCSPSLFTCCADSFAPLQLVAPTL